jgi:hypothetical protein
MDPVSTPKSIDLSSVPAPSSTLAWAIILKVAKRALVDPKTVKRRLNGKPTRRGTGRRIDAALKLYKLEKYIPGPPATPPAADSTSGSAASAEVREDRCGESQSAV